MEVKRGVLIAAMYISFSHCFPLLGQCQEDKGLFKLLSSSRTGVNFKNSLDDTGTVNFMSHTYIYNGAGVAVGDIDNDGLDDIFFSGNMRSSRLYRNEGNLKFSDITSASGVGDADTDWATGANMADVNGDGWLDLYVCYTNLNQPESRRNRLYINQQDGTFKEEAKEYGLDDDSYSVQSAFFDFDGDGDLDMYLLNYNSDHIPANEWENSKFKRDPYAGDKLYENRNGKFVDISAVAGIKGTPLGYGLGVAVGDINGDSWPDIYVSNDFVEPDYLYINNQDGTFTELMSEYFQHISHFSMGSNLNDFNNDGAVDLFTLDMLPEDNKRQKLLYGPENYEEYARRVTSGFYFQDMRNMLHLNNANGTFSEIGQFTGISNTDWSWSALSADFDNDGWKDLFITNGYYKDVTNKDFLKFRGDYYFNQSVKRSKVDTTYIVNQTVSTPIHNYIFKNTGNLKFEDKSDCWGIDQPGFSNGAAYSDLDNDGDLDLVTNNIDAKASIYENMSTKLFPDRHYLALKLIGTGGNTGGYNAKVNVYSKDRLQTYEKMPVRGFQSSVGQTMHIGLGKTNQVDSLEVIWNHKSVSVVKHPEVDRILTLDQTEAVKRPVRQDAPTSPYFRPSNLIDYVHREYPINDFKRQPLLTTMPSIIGPVIKVADLDGNGTDDIILGASKNSATRILLQSENGKFIDASIQGDDIKSSDAAIAVADFDGDGDMDVYLGSGGYYDYAPKDDDLQDRLLLQENGNFILANGNLPTLHYSTGALEISDFDKDGDIDIFVGSRIIPGMYPETPPSFILRNDGHGKFEDVTSAIAPTLSSIGMVAIAKWADIDNDGWQDLIVGGEFMPLTVYINNKGKGLIDKSSTFFSEPLSGLWSAIDAADYDNDGDIDFVVGNFGLNSQLKASPNQPLSLTYADFDQNGSIDPIVTYYNQGKEYPFASRDEITNQIFALRKKFPTYESYSDAQLVDIFSKKELQEAKKLTANTLESYYIENSSGQFKVSPLPSEAQFAPVNAIYSYDFNKDGNMDFVLAGNQSFIRIRLGVIDANYGELFLGDGHGSFKMVPQKKCGLNLKGDVKSIQQINIGGYPYLTFGINNSRLATYAFRK
ncbi:VCBS repeat-containing protein [Flavobacteriaceae bacterium F89]|uniref:VCBS repeat-containing protein n=1 Tax=Cerina litoralis TaxID=2874477 RepID=A0AAE3EXY0_9FLAO|nr:VCBS repeat-containing protein [Cerina litoralis]MCG2462550.1 VCBS repeat-containing protein [Cerina litoralis]